MTQELVGESCDTLSQNDEIPGNLPETVVKFLEDNPSWTGYVDLLLLAPSWEEIIEEFPDAGGSSLRDREDHVTSYGIPCLALYHKMRKEGQGHKFSEMIAMQSGPRLNTDDTFFAGFGRLYEQFGSQRHLDRYLQFAKQQGFTPSPNAVYFPGLARRPGDPEAWVTRAQGRAHIRKVLESRGWGCDGAINLTAREPEEDPLDKKNCRPLGEDIIQRNMSRMLAANPDLKRKSRGELREAIIAKHGPSK